MNRIKIKSILVKGSKVFLISLAVAMLIFTFLSTKFNKDYGNGFMGRKFFIVLSDSMKPKFQAGDVVVTKVVDSDDLEVGDTITFYVKSGEVVTHQIEEKTVIDSKEAFITKGLNVDKVDDEPVLASNVIGKYSFSIPYAGHLLNFMKTPLGYICLILIPLLIIITLNAIQFLKAFKIYKNEKKTEIDRKNAELEAERQKNIEMQQELARLKEQMNISNNG